MRIHVKRCNETHAALRPAVRLDREEFACYLDACKRGGARFSAAAKAQLIKLEHLAGVVLQLRDAGFDVQVAPELAPEAPRTAAPKTTPRRTPTRRRQPHVEVRFVRSFDSYQAGDVGHEPAWRAAVLVEEGYAELVQTQEAPGDQPGAHIQGVG